MHNRYKRVKPQDPPFSVLISIVCLSWIVVARQTRYNEEDERAIVNGAHTNATLQQLVHKYVELFVLCPNCKLPESSEFFCCFGVFWFCRLLSFFAVVCPVLCCFVRSSCRFLSIFAVFCFVFLLFVFRPVVLVCVCFFCFFVVWFYFLPCTELWFVHREKAPGWMLPRQMLPTPSRDVGFLVGWHRRKKVATRGVRRAPSRWEIALRCCCDARLPGRGIVLLFMARQQRCREMRKTTAWKSFCVLLAYICLFCKARKQRCRKSRRRVN